MSDEAKAAERIESSNRLNVGTKHYTVAELHDDAAVLAARVRELEAERWKCVGCGAEFPCDDLEAIGDVKYCSQCAKVQALGGVVNRLEAELLDCQKSCDAFVEAYGRDQARIAELEAEMNAWQSLDGINWYERATKAESRLAVAEANYQDCMDRLGEWQSETGCTHPAAAHQKIADLRSLLRELEWEENPIFGGKECPICGLYKTSGHADDCRLAKAIQETPNAE